MPETTDAKKKLPAWKSETTAERIHKCRMMLHLHGFLTDAENERVKRRQVKRGMVPKNCLLTRIT